LQTDKKADLAIKSLLKEQIMKKTIGISIAVALLLLSVFVWWRFYFVFAEGVKAGNLNYFEKKGFIFKTYEGRLVQDGFKSTAPGNLQSNEFRFSTENSEVAKKLERSSGLSVELRYKEYFSALPWRGASNFVATEVLSVEGSNLKNNIPPGLDEKRN